MVCFAQARQESLSSAVFENWPDLFETDRSSRLASCGDFGCREDDGLTFKRWQDLKARDTLVTV
ncbi:hypothetical protein A3D69_02550 [Candidatus Uhrbacteria bacterium RIFCSPHIGHO2_02_FULL_54_11]|nr:MAG: hypothetical protein A3D69_02550 [Candidatus Uhrbacteria bacterium RIFCSPHIGHO2_02_FULL_54_11]